METFLNSKVHKLYLKKSHSQPKKKKKGNNNNNKSNQKTSNQRKKLKQLSRGENKKKNGWRERINQRNLKTQKSENIPISFYLYPWRHRLSHPPI